MPLFQQTPGVLDCGKSEVLGLAVVSNEEFLTAGFDGVHRWSLVTGEKRCSYREYSGSVCWSVACNAPAKAVLAGFGDRTLWLWDLDSGKERRQLVGDFWIPTCVALSPDGRWALNAAPDKKLRVWDTATGRERTTIHGKKAFCWRCAWSPTGEHFAAGGYDKTATLYADDGRQLHTLPHAGRVEAVAFSPDGKLLATAGGEKTVRLWAVRGGEEKHALAAGKKKLDAVAFTPDGRHVIAGDSAGEVRAWDVKSGQLTAAASAPMKTAILSLAATPDGRHVLAGCWGGKVVVWGG
jgi:WD40 repeat protein